MPLPFSRFLAVPLTTAVLFIANAARAADYTDLWWTPAESGWGVNVVQSESFMFVTFFIFGTDNKPTWYTGQLTRDATGAFSGGLFLSTGTYYLKPWNPGDVIPAQPVGSVQFRPSTTSAYQATLTYVVDGAGTVTKAIERQTLTQINLAGSYTGGLAATKTACGTPTSYRATYDLQVAQSLANAATFTFSFPPTECKLSGNLVQHGGQYTMTGATYKCTQNNSTTLDVTANLAEIKATSQGIEGVWTASVGGGCVENAYFSAVLN